MAKKIEDGVEVEDTVPPAKPAENADQDPDFDKELADLEANGGQPAPAPAKPGKTPEQELEQAKFTAKSVAKRIRELGGDPAAAIADESAPPAPAPIDTSRFVTHDDLAAQEARKLARSEGEYKVIMWHVKNKGLSVEDAHLLANKSRIKTTLSEITRTKSAVPSRGGAGPGQAPIVDTDEPVMPDQKTLDRLAQSGMKYDPAQKAFVGKVSALSWVKGRGWVTGRVVPDRK